MGKVFLSHSSSDKSFVEPIADLLGKTKCVYDKYTFETGMKTLDEIFDNMDNSDIFVYFISESSLSSDWVKIELNKANDLFNSSNNRLYQIYPLIIDDSISHNDERIAPFLRKEYNLQRVDTSILAYRKILQQLSKFDYEKSLFRATYQDGFYGRDAEISRFKSRFDSTTDIKSAVISGIPGIGKKAFIQHALKQAKVIKPYYTPIVLSMPQNGCIDDLIVLISDAGFGSYSLTDIIQINDNNIKIDILAELINKVQKYKELIIIEDDETIVTLSGEIKYWFYNALKKSENGVGIVLTSSVNIDKTHVKNYPEVFFENITELSVIDRIGLLRTYSESMGLELSQSERLYFKDCLTGYPPQVIFCVDLISEKGLDYAKENTAEISEMPEQISSTILDKCQTVVDKESVEGVLAVVAKMETAPIRLMSKICKANIKYQEAINVLKKYSVCYIIGANREYIKMNSFIENFVTRNKMKIPNDIQKILEDELKDFNDNIDSNETLTFWDTSELKFYIKENLKKEKFIYGPFIYSTIILQTVSELYNEQKYRKVIELVRTTQNNERYQYFDSSVKVVLQRYLCQALVKAHDKEFEAEVEYFSERNLLNDYNFLKGFWYRCIGKYNKAEKHLNSVLKSNMNHYAATRELIIVYLSMQDFDSALILAKTNYYRRKDNLFHLQAYLECLLELRKISEEQEKEIEEMLISLKRIHRVKPTSLYFQLLGKYEAYHEKNLKNGIEYINQGLQQFPKSMYLIRDKFDIYRRFGDVNGMRDTIKELSDVVSEFEYQGVLITRKAILDLYLGKTKESVRIFLRNEGFSENAIENVIKKVQ